MPSGSVLIFPVRSYFVAWSPTGAPLSVLLPFVLLLACWAPTMLSHRRDKLRMPDRLTRKAARSKKKIEGAGTVGRDGPTQGDRLAWLLLYDATPPLSRWIHRLLPSFPIHAQTNVGVWESALDGTAMTEIGLADTHQISASGSFESPKLSSRTPVFSMRDR